ncbi:MAG: ParB/Srx family N-terminal domain-containing protein [Deltaproteobacteria bacterium]|nr:ParB/Srx family N-terminal domain-containing protein [Deltaproteobacteria bacterium]
MASEPIEPRPLGPSLERRAPLAPAPVPEPPPARWAELSEIEEPARYRLREPRAIAPLAEAIARDGQREPLIVRRGPTGALELVAGHRRLEALRMLHRRRALVRIHDELDEEGALYLALSDLLDREPLTPGEQARLGERLEGEPSPRVQALLERSSRAAQERPLDEAEGLPEVEEIELEELAARARDQLADSCNDLAALHEVWGDLDEGRRDDLLECVRYLAEMLPLLSDAEEE